MKKRKNESRLSVKSNDAVSLAAGNTQAGVPHILLTDLCGLINEARQNVAITVNASLTMLYWRIGKRIREDILREKRAEYGEHIVVEVSRKLEIEYGRGFSVKSLRHMVRFAEAFTDEKIVSALRRQLGWTHFKTIIYIEDPLKRDFYAEMCRAERWSTRTLEHKIGHLLYERTAVAKKPEKVIEDSIKSLREEDKLTPDMVFKDPYFLDFLGLKDTYAEKDVEAAILRDMELYLRWLDKYERRQGEESPVGVILCAGKKEETVRLLDMEGSGIHVASYWTDALPKKELEQKLHDAVRLARMRLAEGARP